MKLSLLLLPLLSFSAFADFTPSARPPHAPPTVAPCVSLKQMHSDGAETTRSTCEPSRAGQNMVFEFFATWCGPCVRELPKFRALAEEFKGKAEFRLMGTDEREQDLRDFFAKNDYTNFAVAFDTRQEAMDAFKVWGTPTTVVVGPDKKIKLFHVGTTETPEELEKIRKAIRE